MKPAILLRAASIITLMLFAGHTLGMPWTPDHGAQGASLVREMKSYHFDVMGFSRSYWDFYLGFGLIISVCLLLLVVLLWQVSTIAKAEPDRTRPFVAALFATFVALTVLNCLYFFTAPLALTIPIALCLVLAWVFARKPAVNG